MTSAQKYATQKLALDQYLFAYSRERFYTFLVCTILLLLTGPVLLWFGFRTACSVVLFFSLTNWVWTFVWYRRYRTAKRDLYVSLRSVSSSH